MIIYKNINGNISDIILEIHPNNQNEYNYFDFIEINFINKFEKFNLRKITFSEIIDNESDEVFIKIYKKHDDNKDIKFIRYNLNLKTYLGNNIYSQKNIFDNTDNLFNYNVGVKVNSDIKIGIYFNHCFKDLTKIDFTLIPYNSYQFSKLSHIYLLGESNIYKLYYKKNNEIINITFKYNNTNNFHIINYDNLIKIIGSINNLVKIESNNLIFFKIFNYIDTTNIDYDINKDIFTIDIKYINF